MLYLLQDWERFQFGLTLTFVSSPREVAGALGGAGFFAGSRR
jgi:hypothetical protein